MRDVWPDATPKHRRLELHAVRIVVLGGGYAGLSLARTLDARLGAEHELLLVDEDASHLVQHELHRLVRDPALAEDIRIDLTDVFEHVEVHQRRVTGLDVDARTVTLAGEAGSDDGSVQGEGVLSYDVCAVALGAEPATQVPGAREHATPLKRVEHARTIHERAVEVFERSEQSASAGSSSGEPPRIVVAGAGLSGVQVAGELAALASEHGHEVGSSVEIAVVERESSVAPGFDEAFQRAIHDALTARGVDVRTGSQVERVRSDALSLVDGPDLDHDGVVWTGGIAGSSVLGGERPRVDAQLRLGDRTFGFGDAVRIVDRDGQAVPATAQAAVRAAGTVATNVERVVEGGDGLFDPRLERFAFDSAGWMVSIGDGAVAQIGPTVVTGRAANALKTTVGIGYRSSVGALRDAVQQVNDELGIRVDED